MDLHHKIILDEILYGPQLVPISPILEAGSKIFEDKNLRLLAFVDKAKIPRHSLIGDVDIVLPADNLAALSFSPPSSTPGYRSRGTRWPATCPVTAKTEWYPSWWCSSPIVRQREKCSTWPNCPRLRMCGTTKKGQEGSGVEGHRAGDWRGRC